MNKTDNTTKPSLSIREESINYTIDGKKYLGFVYYNEAQKGKRPVILVVHEWWGLNDYSRGRAKQLAELGYLAMAVDVFGGGKTGNDPQSAMALATPFYKEPVLAKMRLDAAINFIKSSPQADTLKMAAIGFCFGGYVVLNAAKLGAELKGVVSFHGGLTGAKPDKKTLKAKILVCHGGDDVYENPHVTEFKKEMDAAEADYTFTIYPNASHAFTNPEATANGKKFNMEIAYNADAEKASWNDMKAFLGKVL